MSIFDSIGHAFSSAAGAVEDAAKAAASGISAGASAAGAAVSVVNNAAENLLDPHLAQLKQQYDAAVNRYNATRVRLFDVRDQFAGALARQRSYAAYNAALLIALQGSTWSDSMFDGYLRQTSQPPAGLAADRVLPEALAARLAAATGDAHVVNAIYGFGSLLNSPLGGGLAPLAGSIASAALGALPLPGPVAKALGAVAAPLLDLASIPGFSPITVVMDIVAKEVGYKKSIDAVNAQSGELDGHAAEIQAATERLGAQVADERRAFLGSMERLDAVDRANFNWRLGAADSDAAWLAAMDAALQQYGIILVLRGDWARMQAAKPDLDFKTFIEFETLRRDAHRYSPKQVVQFITLIAPFSDSLRRAWLASPWANQRMAA